MTWLRTDERKEAVNSLEKVYQFILEVHTDPYNWKWVIIALHNAVQAFLVLALTGTASLNVIKDREKWIEAIQLGNEYPKQQFLLNFLKLYDDIKSKERMMHYGYSKSFKGSRKMDEAMKILNELRNNFIHFIPCNWCLEIAWLPLICRQVILVVEFLILESGNVRFYENNDFEKAKLAELITKIRDELERLEIECNQALT
jgi:hypothetical protein